MNKKKVLKAIGIILLIIFVIFLVHTIRNYIIITDLQNKNSKYSNTENLVESEYEFNNVDDSIFVEPDISQYILKQKYSIKDKDFNLYKNEDDTRYEDYRGIKLLEYDNSNNDYAEIYYISYDYTIDPSFYYTLEITDESNEDEESYMFIYKDNIYEIRIPTNKRIDDEVQLFLDSIKEL